MGFRGAGGWWRCGRCYAPVGSVASGWLDGGHEPVVLMQPKSRSDARQPAAALGARDPTTTEPVSKVLSCRTESGCRGLGAGHRRDPPLRR
jgi:hypothetical protein